MKPIEWKESYGCYSANLGLLRLQIEYRDPRDGSGSGYYPEVVGTRALRGPKQKDVASAKKYAERMASRLVADMLKTLQRFPLDVLIEGLGNVPGLEDKDLPDVEKAKVALTALWEARRAQ